MASSVKKSLLQKLLKSVNHKSQSIMLGMLFDVFLFILTHISMVLFFPGSAEADIG